MNAAPLSSAAGLSVRATRPSLLPAWSMLAALVLAAPWPCSQARAATADGELARSSIAAKDLRSKFEKDVNAYIAASDKDDRGAQLEAEQKLQKTYDGLAKRAKVTQPLAMLGDWELVWQLAKPDIRELKAAPGKGFVRYTYVDAQSGTRVGVLVSLPAAYGRGDELFPAVIALKPHYALEGATLEGEVRKHAETAYKGLLDKAIVLIPLGVETGSGRAGVLKETEGSWLATENIPAFVYGSLNILFQQVPYDRARVILDGWQDAGEDAVRLASLFQSVFAGVINRSGEPGGDDVLWANFGNVPILYVDGQADGRGADIAPLQKREGVEVTVVADLASSLDLSDEAAAKVAEWVTARQRPLAPTTVFKLVADAAFQNAAWLKARVISKRATARPGDRDFPRLAAKVDREANRISIESVNVLEMYVYLSDAIVDLDRQVVIEVNGKEVSKKTYRRDLGFMLQNRYLNNSGDDGLWVAEQLLDKIDANVPADKDGGG